VLSQLNGLIAHAYVCCPRIEIGSEMELVACNDELVFKIASHFAKQRHGRTATTASSVAHVPT